MTRIPQIESSMERKRTGTRQGNRRFGQAHVPSRQARGEERNRANIYGWWSQLCLSLRIGTRSDVSSNSAGSIQILDYQTAYHHPWKKDTAHSLIALSSPLLLFVLSPRVQCCMTTTHSSLVSRMHTRILVDWSSETFSPGWLFETNCLDGYCTSSSIPASPR